MKFAWFAMNNHNSVPFFFAFHTMEFSDAHMFMKHIYFDCRKPHIQTNQLKLNVVRQCWPKHIQIYDNLKSTLNPFG